jgi:hypothetical protein
MGECRAPAPLTDKHAAGLLVVSGWFMPSYALWCVHMSMRSSLARSSICVQPSQVGLGLLRPQVGTGARSFWRAAHQLWGWLTLAVGACVSLCVCVGGCVNLDHQTISHL